LHYNVFSFFFFSSRRRHTRLQGDWSSDVCSSDLSHPIDFVKAAKLDWMGVFEYSDVDNAGSYALDEKVDAEAISDRRNRLMAIQKKISRENLRAKYLRTKPGATKDRAFTALIEGPSKENPLIWEARLEGMAPEIDGK